MPEASAATRRTDDGRRFTVRLDAEAEPPEYLVLDEQSDWFVYGSPDEEGAEQMARKLNEWWDLDDQNIERRDRANKFDHHGFADLGFVTGMICGMVLAVLVAVAVFLLSCAPLPPTPDQKATICGTENTYSPDQACAALVGGIDADPFCQDAGIHGHPEGCAHVLGTEDGGACAGAEWFCPAGVDSLVAQLAASGCNPAAVVYRFVCWPGGK